MSHFTKNELQIIKSFINCVTANNAEEMERNDDHWEHIDSLIHRNREAMPKSEVTRIVLDLVERKELSWEQDRGYPKVYRLESVEALEAYFSQSPADEVEEDWYESEECQAEENYYFGLE